MSYCLRIALILNISACTAFAAAPIPSGIVVTSLNVTHSGNNGRDTFAEITINNSLTLRDIRVLTVGGRTLLKFPESISKRGKVFPQVRLTSRPAREAVYSAVETQSSSSRWGPLSYQITRVTRYGKKSSLKAFVLVNFGGSLEVECRVFSGNRGLHVGWPSRKQDSGWVDQVTIDDSKLKSDVEGAVIAAYEK